MSRAETKAVTPRLRFPEFRDAGPWEVKRLGEVAGLKAGDFIPASEIRAEYEEGLNPCYGGNGLRGFTESFTHVGEFPLIGRQGAYSGNVQFATGKFHATEHAVVVTSKKNTNTKFLYFLLVRAELSRLVTGQAQPGLSVTVLNGVTVPIPSILEEQQKIADCLSSLDELIRAEVSRLEALQAHKKGLMQQLFPVEGETTPRLRFPEFRNAGPWEVRWLGEIATRVTEQVGSKILTPVSITANRGFVPQTTKFGRDISGKQYARYIRLRFGQFAYNKGNSKSYPQGAVYQLLEFPEAAVPNVFYCFQFKEGYFPEFYKGYFQLNFHGAQLEKFITSGARSNGLLNIRADDFFSIILPTPREKAEQQQIADCLSSLDDLIRVQGERIEALKQHKKGLMQQLFPSLDEVRE